ncbi:MAG: hypothetical protein NVV59_07625 [Chitinophagaceae bacterium]|nr:hypothetical protein [Chitinophagaceae bacterium]
MSQKVNNQVFFGANDGTNGMELWKSDGTASGTVLVKDIFPGSGSSSIGYITAVESQVYFVANNGTNGVELWKSDGTTDGTVMVKDIRAGNGSSFPAALAAMGSTLLFSATDGANGAELWKDGWNSRRYGDGERHSHQWRFISFASCEHEWRHLFLCR